MNAYKKTVSAFGDGSFRIANHSLTLVVDANKGGRITSFAYRDLEILTQPAVHPENYGSTFWDAPQSRWQWPPPVTLDSAAYTAHVDGERLILKSAVDAASGLQFIKQFRLMEDPAHLEVIYSIRNTSSHVIRTGAWEITRVPGGLSFFPFNYAENLPESTLPDVETINDITWYEFAKTRLPAREKSCFGSCEGWLANVTPHNLLFVKSFEEISPPQYAPGNAHIEIYGHDDGVYLELENHGPYTELKPGVSLDYGVRWNVGLLSTQMDIAAGNPELVTLARNLAKRT